MIPFALGFAFTVVLAIVLVALLLKMGLLKSHGDVVYRFEAHRELTNGTLDLMRERANSKMETMESIFKVKLEAAIAPIQKDLEDARVGVLNLAHRMDKQEDKLESLANTGSIEGENRSLPKDMEVVGGGAIGND